MTCVSALRFTRRPWSTFGQKWALCGRSLEGGCGERLTAGLLAAPAVSADGCAPDAALSGRVCSSWSPRESTGCFGQVSSLERRAETGDPPKQALRFLSPCPCDRPSR